jgi:hypothetical protein
VSGGEVVILIASACVAVLSWGSWYVAPMVVRRMGRRSSGRLLVQLAPLVCAAALWVVLRNASAHDVRDDPEYLTFYLVLGAAWVGVWIRWLAMTGVSTRDDVVERSNGSAAIVVAGAMLGITLCYAGGNIGDGPGWWVVVFSAGLASVALFAAWMLLEIVSGVSETVTVDRDPSAGLRLAGFLIGCGLILGRSVAGDWVSADATVRDFALAAWPVAVLVVVAAVVERAARPTPAAPRPALIPYGLFPALLYIGGALYQVQRLGPAV